MLVCISDDRVSCTVKWHPGLKAAQEQEMSVAYHFRTDLEYINSKV